ncbi:MAG: shikimate dehydrogenase [Burkholderiaceae bacterium]|nr:shikimate dehydrogenase [Burkholderiales bacterium]MCZ8340443.1 shikimate dehydrogenase [Burkholderiaceae bacterium]
MAAASTDQVDFVNGGTRLFGIVGDPIAQVRSPEMVTWELRRRGLDAVLVPIHVFEAEFDAVLPALMRVANLDGLVFTIPFKRRACALAASLGAQARAVGAINALARGADGRWHGEIFDGLGCVEGLQRAGVAVRGARVMLVGLGGAGTAIAAAFAAERPASMRLFDLDAAHCGRVAAMVQAASPVTEVEVGPPVVDGVDLLVNATPVGMLDDPRLPIEAASLPSSLVVFDAIVKPEVTPLLAFAASQGCRAIGGREMMRGQIARIVDFLAATRRG